MNSKLKIKNFLIISLLLLTFHLAVKDSFSFPDDSYQTKARAIPRSDLKRYFEKAMALFEEGKYREAIIVFENLIKIESKQDESYFSAFSEIYIEKSKERLKEMVILDDKKWARMKRNVIEEEKTRKEEEEELVKSMDAGSIERMEKERRKNIRKRAYSEEKKEIMAHPKSKKPQKKIYITKRIHEDTLKTKLLRIESFLDKARGFIKNGLLSEAESIVRQAQKEFPTNEKFKDILHYIGLEKIKLEEKALKRAREITEEKMLLEVARQHLLPEDKIGTLKDSPKGSTLMKVPEIRKKLKIPISIDFKDVELDYVLGFLSDATGVNIISSKGVNGEERVVTIKIKDMPLKDTLDYIIRSQDLIYRIEQDAIWVTTKDELKDERLDTRVYFLNQGIIRFNEDNEGGVVKTIKDVVEGSCDWPKDSKLTLDKRTGAIIISNTPTNLNVIENLLYSLDATPKQVLVEARFVEVQLTDVDELGIDWKLNSDWGVSQNNSKQNKHGISSGSGVDFSNFSAVTASQGFNLTYQGILSHPQFQAVMHALEQKQNVKTLSSPRITTLNNETATIKVIDEYIYPKRYEVSLVQYDINGDGDFDDAGETEWVNIPQDFITRDVGILLHVKPSIGADNKTITLALSPEISEDSGSPFSYEGEVTIPQFKTRNLNTTVIIDTGETVVLGGLIKEVNTNVTTKVPVLGNIPFIGGLFRKHTDNVERRNLLIFVTAKILELNTEVAAKGDNEI